MGFILGQVHQVITEMAQPGKLELKNQGRVWLAEEKKKEGL